MATVGALRETVAAALEAIADSSANSAASASCSVGGVIDPPPPLPGLVVHGVGSVPLPVPPSTFDKLQSLGDVSDCDTARHIAAHRMHLTSEWSAAVERTACSHLERLRVVGVPLRVELNELIVIAPFAMYQLEEAPHAFATLIIQLPGGGGALACTTSNGERTVLNLDQGCNIFFYAVTCLNGGAVSGSSTAAHRVFLRYDLFCNDKGPIPKVANAGRPEWLLDRAAYTWNYNRRMKGPKILDQTPEKLAILLDEKEETRFSKLQGRDLAIVQALRKSGRFSLRLVITSKTGAIPAGCWQSHLNLGTRVKSSIRPILWVDEDDTKLTGFRLSISDNDALRNNGHPSPECWSHRTLLVFWLKEDDILMTCKADASSAIGYAAKAVRSDLPAERALLQTVLDCWRDNLPDPQSVAQLLNIVVQGNDSNSTRRVLALMVSRDSDSEDGYVLGLATGQHVLAVLDAVQKFGWPTVMDGVRAVVDSTDELLNVVKLSKGLLEKHGYHEPAMEIFRSVLARVYERGSMPTNCIEYIIQLLFTNSNLTKERTTLTLAISSSFAKLKCDLAVVVEAVSKFCNVFDEAVMRDRQSIVLAYLSELGTKSDGFVSAAKSAIDLFSWYAIRETLLTAVETSFGQASTFCRAAQLCVELYARDSTKNAAREITLRLMMKASSHAPLMDILNEVADSLFEIVSTMPGMNLEKRNLYMAMAAKGSPRLASWIRTSLDLTRNANKLSTKALLDGLLPHLVRKKDLEPSTPSSERFALARRVWVVLLEAQNASAHQSRFVSTALSHPALLANLLCAQFRRFHPHPELERMALALKEQLTNMTNPWVKSLSTHQRNVQLQLLKFFLTQPAPVETPSSPEVIIVENTSSTPVPQPAAKRTTNRSIENVPQPLDDEIAEVTVLRTGTDASVDLVHLRQNCGVYGWSKGNAANNRVCPKCYCYVCDIPAAHCDKWEEHCHANDREDYWKQLKEKGKPQPTPPKRRRTNARGRGGHGRRRARHNSG